MFIGSREKKTLEVHKSRKHRHIDFYEGVTYYNAELKQIPGGRTGLTMKKGTIQWVRVVLLTGYLVIGGLSAWSWGAELNLFDAAAVGDLVRVKSFITAKADVNAKNKDGTTALMYACENGRVEVVQVLLGAKADVKAKNNYGATALMRASGNGRVEVVQVLLGAKADVNAKDNYGATALMRACEKGRVEVVQVLLATKADVNAKDKDGTTALMRASKKGRVEVEKLLRQAGAL